MKKILLIFTVFVLTISVKAQYPITQNLGSPSTLVRVPTPGGFQASLINRNFADTIAANLTPISFYPGAMIFTTGDSSIWLRGTGATKWIKQFGNTSGAGGDTLIWKMSGNTVGLRQATPVLGTLDNYDLNIMTSGTTTMVVPQGGIIRSSASPNKYLLIDTITRRLHYGDGGSSSTPTWQQTLTAGSTLTGNNTIDNGSNTFEITNNSLAGTRGFKLSSTSTAAAGNAQTLFEVTLSGANATASQSTYGAQISNSHTGSGTNYGLSVGASGGATNIGLNVANGSVRFPTLTNDSGQDRLIGTTSGNNLLGYVTLGTGLSLSSGVLSNSGVTSTPTWQQVLTAGSTLTTDNTIDIGGNELIFSNGGTIELSTVNGVTSSTIIESTGSSIGLQAAGSTANYNSAININTDSIKLFPHLGRLSIDTLLNKSNQNALMGWDSTGTDRGQVGYVTLGSGLSLSSGVLNTSGTVPTPISSLTAATGTNSIDNTTFGQSWSWTNLVNTGLSLTSASTAAPAGTSHKILSITASGANATASASTFGVFSANTHTGTNSANYGVYGSSSNGTLNVGTVGISSGGTTSIGGQFSSSGGTTNYGVTGSVTGAATTNYGAEFSASGGTTNNALNIAAGALTLNGSAGTSGQVLTSAGASTLPTWTTPSTVATAVPLSGITAATGSNSINNGNNTQTWNWPTLTNGTGLLLTSLASTTGTTGGSVLTVLRSGALANASQTTYGAIIQNQHTGTTETNVGLKVEATGATNNYALIVPASSGNVGIGTTSPSASALLDVSSTTKGALMPRMTTTQRDAISSPATGLELFNTTTNTKQIYDGTRWVEAAHPLYKVYTALLSQSGTDAPVATVLENNLGGTVVWTRSDVGDYTATLSGAFTANKTWLLFGTTANVDPDGYGGANWAFSFTRTSSDAISLIAVINADRTDDAISAQPIEIRVYY